MRIFRKGFNYSQDGPGNRLVIHMQGCNLHCPWCSNPEGIPVNFGLSEEIPNDEIVDMCIDAQAVMFDGGGVTFTGGESTIQLEDLRYCLTQIQKAGIHTAIETNGTNPLLPELYEHLNLLIIDLKHYDSEISKHVIGAGNETIIRNLKAAQAEYPDVIVRVPLINGFNASKKDAIGFANLLSQFPFPVELLPYHEYGKSKYKLLGLEYTIEGGFVSEKALEDFTQILLEAGVQLINT